MNLTSRDDDEFLEDIVPGRQYTYYDMLHGIINHDLYHTGQIVILKKAFTFQGAGSRYENDVDEYGSPFGSSSEHDDYY